MKQLPYGKRISLIGVLSVAGLVFLLAGLSEVSAQFMGQGTQLEPEQTEAARTLAARGVAHDLALSEENASKLIDAYKAARESYDAARAEMIGSAMGGGGMMGGGMAGGGMMGGGMAGGGMMGGGMAGGLNLEFVTAEQDKLEEALTDFLSADQVSKALESLGTFSSNWDNQLNVIAGFDLDDETLFKALALINTYVVDSEKAIEAAMTNQDFHTMISAMQTHKAALDGALADILSSYQFVMWISKTITRTRGAGAHGGGF